MMGEQQRGGKGASWRALGAMIPAYHVLRRIDGLIDLGELRDALASHYSRRGRPSIAPELLVRMALIARLYGITSERRLCEEVRFNLAYRWFCQLPLDAPAPHHSTFSKNRHGRFRDAGIFSILFEQTVQRCADAGLIAHKDAGIDASFVAADASWQRMMRDAHMAAPRLPRPVCEWLADQANAPPQEYGVRRGKPADLPPAEWPRDYDSLDHGRDIECRARSTSRKRLSASYVKLRLCWRRERVRLKPAAGSRSASRLIIAGARNMAV